MDQQFQMPSRTTQLVSIAIVLSTFFMGACTSTPKRHSPRPDWVDILPDGGKAAVGAASYEIFGEMKARETALMKALTTLALQKGGTVDLESHVATRQVVNTSRAGESFQEQASIKTTAIVKGKEIPINAQITAFWKDTLGRRVWVLIEEE